MDIAYAYSDYYRFFRSWVANPLRVAAIAPSGVPLARLMTTEISASTGPVLEPRPRNRCFHKGASWPRCR